MKQKTLTKETVVEKWEKSHPTSKKLHDKAIDFFTANGATHSARILDPFRPYVTHAKGSRKWDVDGNEYIDYVMGHGALILGHSHPAIVKAVQEQAAKGIHFGENTEAEIEWGGLIKAIMPVAERVEFCACGQEANQMAVILARAYTGRTKILRFENNYHGWGGEVAPYDAVGIYQPAVTLLPMHDMNKVEKALSTKEYALCMIEGGGATMAGATPWDYQFVKNLAALCKKYGTLFLIDEVVTGFRESRGGWQEVVGVKPDMSSLGKCVSGGIPSGVIVGRADIMDGFNPKRPLERRVVHHGTWNANPLQSVAGVAACKLYLDGASQKRAFEAAGYLRDKGNAVLKKLGISARLYGRTIVHLYFGPIDSEPKEIYLPPTRDIKNILNPAQGPMKARLCLHMLQRGVATMGARFFVMSGAHTNKDIDETVDALEDSLKEMLAEGSLKQ
jgi:glutamate-1-semialdehyde 2,1-aminomutase